METIDLSDILTPSPDSTLVIEATETIGPVRTGDLVLINKNLAPTTGDIILEGEHLNVYRSNGRPDGVAYCLIRTLSH